MAAATGKTASKKILTACELVSELAMARNCEESKVEELLSSALSKCKLRFPEASEFQA